MSARDGYVVLNADDEVFTDAPGDEWADDHPRVYRTRRAAERATRRVGGRVVTYDYWEPRFCSKQPAILRAVRRYLS